MNADDFWDVVATVRSSPAYEYQLPYRLKVTLGARHSPFFLTVLKREVGCFGAAIGVDPTVIAGGLLMELRDMKRRGLL